MASVSVSARGGVSLRSVRYKTIKQHFSVNITALKKYPDFNFSLILEIMKQPPLFQICKQRLSAPCLVYMPDISGLLHPASSMSVFHPIPLMFCLYTHGFTRAAEHVQCAFPKELMLTRKPLGYKWCIGKSSTGIISVVAMQATLLLSCFLLLFFLLIFCDYPTVFEGSTPNHDQNAGNISLQCASTFRDQTLHTLKRCVL